MRRRSACRSRSRTSAPPSRIAPDQGSYRRGNSLMSVDLPEPVEPTTATVSPFQIGSDSCSSTGWPGRYPNVTRSISMSGVCTPAREVAGATSAGAAVRAGASGSSVSSNPNTRSAAAIACCMIVYFADRSRIGPKNLVRYSMNATSTPKVSVPATMRPPPCQIRPAMAIDATASMIE